LRDQPCRRTAIVKRAVALLALESVAVHVTRVRPIANSLPERGLQLTGTGPSTASLALTVKRTRTRVAARGAVVVLDVAPEITGGVRSNV
jgi:hypothetical protein